MSAIFDFLDNQELDSLNEYIKRPIKLSKSTTGSITIDQRGDRILSDSSFDFVALGVEPGNTVQIFATTPASTSPSTGFHTIFRVLDSNNLVISGKVNPLGSNISYRIFETGSLQEKINVISDQISTIENIDLAEALFQERISKPWYNEVSKVMAGFPVVVPTSGGYFTERNGLDDSQFTSPVTDTDLTDATSFPPLTLTPPGPLLFPFTHTLTNPLRVPALNGLPDSGPRTPTPFNPPSQINVQSDLGELPAIQEEDNFYSSTTFPYDSDEEQRLNSIKTAITNALNRQILSLNGIASFLDENILDLQTRGATGTLFYATISVARKRVDDALTKANFHLTDLTDGVPAITTSGNPTAARLNYIQNVRPPEITNRVAEILVDQDPWVEMRYTFLARRVNRVDGSLALIARNNFRLTDSNDRLDVLLQEREDIRVILGVE